MLQENVTVPKSGVTSVTKSKMDLVLAQSLNPSITLKAEELLNIMDFIHIDMELYAHVDFKYK